MNIENIDINEVNEERISKGLLIENFAQQQPQYSKLQHNNGDDEKLLLISQKNPLDSKKNLNYNFAAESSLLGALLFNNSSIQHVDDFLLSKHFYVPIHGKIFEIIKSLHQRGLLASVVTISASLSGENFFKNNQSAAESFLENLVQNSALSTEVYGLGRHIFDLSVKRQIAEISESIIVKLADPSDQTSAIDHIIAAEKRLSDLAMHGDSSRDYQKISDIAFSVLEKIDFSKKNEGRLVGLPTGFSDMNKILGGLQNSDLIIIAGRPGMGKTSFALSLSLNIAEFIRDQKIVSEGSIAFFSLEMSDEQLVTRLISMKSNVNSARIRNGHVRDDEFSKISLACNNISELGLIIDDNPAISIGELRNKARRIMRKEKLSAIFVDYLQLLRGNNKSSEANRVNEISEISRGLKSIAKELDIPVIALSQLSREVEKREDKKPHLADLRESGSIEQDADIVMFIYREEYYLFRKQPEPGTEKHEEWQREMERLRNSAEIIVAKHRNGPVGSFRLLFDHDTTEFKDPSVYNYES
jgi:replicative DNA helicase